MIANYLASSIVDEVFAAPGQHSSLEILIAVYAYAVQIYADFSGLHGHRDRDRAPARLLVPAELRLALRGHLAAGLLAPLAHDAVPLAARLRLHPARRQPWQASDPDLPQPAADDAARRAVARRRVDLRRLGSAPRRRARRRAAVGRAARRHRAPVDRVGDAGGRASSSSTSSASRGSSSGPTPSTRRGR